MITGIPCKKNHRLAQKCHLIIIIAVVILISQIPTFISWLLWHEKADIFYLIFSISDWIPSQDIFYFFSLFFHSNKHGENHIAVCFLVTLIVQSWIQWFPEYCWTSIFMDFVDELIHHKINLSLKSRSSMMSDTLRTIFSAWIYGSPELSSLLY